jgi:hypothetical protein
MTAFSDILRARQRPARPARPIAAPWRPMRQKQAARWALDAPAGQTLRGQHHRAMRLIVEAMELARVSGVSEPQMQAMLSAAFTRDAGDVRRTAGGVGVALLMLCDALNVDADEAEISELNRILTLLESQRDAPPVRATSPLRPPDPLKQARGQERREERPQEDFGHHPQ